MLALLPKKQLANRSWKFAVREDFRFAQIQYSSITSQAQPTLKLSVPVQLILSAVCELFNNLAQLKCQLNSFACFFWPGSADNSTKSHGNVSNTLMKFRRYLLTILNNCQKNLCLTAWPAHGGYITASFAIAVR